MSNSDLLTQEELARELDVGPATIQYWLRRFAPWIPHTLVNGEARYTKKVLANLFFIAEEIESGRLPTQIEEILHERSPVVKASSKFEKNQTSGNLGKILEENGLGIFEGLLDNIGLQQERIAKAHERRAEAEERKAVAIEKRAIAEQKKADAIEKRATAEERKAEAMNNIANALQSMKHEVFPGPAADSLAREAVTAIALDEFRSQETFQQETFRADPKNKIDDIDDLSSLHHDKPLTGAEPALHLPEIDDLSLLIQDDIQPKMEVDDLSLLLDDPKSDTQNQGTLDDLSLLIQDDTQPKMEVDDLSLLLDDPKSDTQNQGTMDDLSLLIQDDAQPNMEVDNLSLLLDDPKSNTQSQETLDDLSLLIKDDTQAKMEVDNLSLLLDDPQSNTQSQGTVDDLSLLIQDDAQPKKKVDDLSLLVGDPKSDTKSIGKMDDLSALLDGDKTDAPSLKPDITPQEDLKAYKAAIINTIIRLKKEGLSVEETTKRFNDDDVPTLSGKKGWSIKAISQIYSFLKTAKK